MTVDAAADQRFDRKTAELLPMHIDLTTVTMHVWPRETVILDLLLHDIYHPTYISNDTHD